jgi:hypothetical protein
MGMAIDEGFGELGNLDWADGGVMDARGCGVK